VLEGSIMAQTTSYRIALAGNPNCGKTALFNALTHGNQKVGNYPGVTVEKREGSATSPSKSSFCIVDLPGIYSLDPKTPDEQVTRDILQNRTPDTPALEGIIIVADAIHMQRSLGLAIELKTLGLPLVLALNRMDLSEKLGQQLDLTLLQKELGFPVIPTIAIQDRGINEILQRMEEQLTRARPLPTTVLGVAARFAEVDRILEKVTLHEAKSAPWTDRLDRVVLHPLWGSLILLGVVTLLFQCIFTWAALPMEGIRNLVALLGDAVNNTMAPGPLRSLLVDGVITGVGAVLVFLPQILLLFLFILLLEDSGYMARAAFLMDRIMGKVGLHGRAFIPLLSSFACTVPGILATRTIDHPKDRLTTILIAPLITCSARLPVYTLLIGAFIPDTSVFGFLNLQGLVMLGLYLLGIFSALLMGFIFRKTLLRGGHSELLMELPSYQWPSGRNLILGLWEKTVLFLQRAGTVILALSILLWAIASYPKPGANTPADQPAILATYAGKIGQFLEPVVAPLGFNWKIAVALIPGFAARETMVGALATVYSLEGHESAQHMRDVLGPAIRKDWSLATALSLLIWYVFSCQCLSTLAVTRRETNSWRWPLFMFFYMTVLAYSASFLTYQLASRGGLG